MADRESTEEEVSQGKESFLPSWVVKMRSKINDSRRSHGMIILEYTHDI